MNEKKITAIVSILAFSLACAALVPVGMAAAEDVPLAQSQETMLNQGTDHCIETEESTLLFPTETFAEYFQIEDEYGTFSYSIHYGAAVLSYYIEKDFETPPSDVVVEIPAEVEGYPVQYIDEYSMNDFKFVSEVILPDTIIAVGARAFQDSGSLKKVVLSEGITEIGAYAFRNCTSLTEIELPSSLTKLGDAAFAGSGLESITIPSSLQEVSSYCFQNCTALKTLELPENMKVDSFAFKNTGFTEVLIPAGTSLGTFAFSDCANLTSVTIESVDRIDSRSFNGSAALSDIYFHGSVDVWNAVYNALPDHPIAENAIIHCASSYANLNGDLSIDASDAAAILAASAAAGSGADTGLSQQQILDADVNFDGAFNAEDAAMILQYSAAFGTGEKVTLADFLK